MTEVFIAALSTTRFEMNDEDQQFYRDEKAKEIQEVRGALQQLHQFSQLPKKERPQANHSLVWKNLLILSKILGFEADFHLIDQLRIPEAILTQQLWHLNDPFNLKHYYPRTSIGQWETTSDRYYILMQGIVQKELIRSSIAKFDGEIDLSLSKATSNSNSKFKKNNRRRFARSDEQIPICLNSKRSQGRNPEVMAGNFRALTDVRMLEVSSSSWRRYVDDFKKLQEEYLMNFIRKKLNISLNLQEKALKQEGEEGSQEAFYSLVTLQRKNVLEFSEFEILLLYMGEILVTTNNYKIEVSRGCVLNPGIHQAFRGENGKGNGAAVTKSLSTVIKISIKKLENYLRVAEEERQGLIKLLKGLQDGRRNKKEEERALTIRPVETSLASLKHSKILHRFYNGQQTQGETRPICHSPSAFKKRSMDSTPIIRSKDKVIGLKSIECMVEKTAKAAQLKHIQYLKRAHLSEDSHARQYSQENTVPKSLFKDCMRNIQNKNEMLKQAVKFQREKLKHEFGHRQKLLNADLRAQTASKGKIASIVDGSIYIKKRIKDIYIRTEASQEMITFTSSERTSTSPKTKTTSRETVGSSLQMREFTDKQLYTGFYKWYTGGLGVMKKLPTGKIRRIKIK